MPLYKQLLNHLTQSYRIHSWEQLLDLLSPDEHPAFLQAHRSRLIIDRVRFLATLLALLMPLWLIVDMLLLPRNALLPIAVIRLLSSGAFALLAISWKFPITQRYGWIAMSLLLINLPITSFASAHILLAMPIEGSARLANQLYALLPYITIGLLALFPLTVLEGAMLTLPLALITITGWSFYANADILQLLPTVWLLFIALGIVFFASTLQLQYMISLINRCDFDPVTGALTRRSGMENLIRALERSIMNDENLSVALLEVDDVKAIIADYDYATYDHVVQEAAEILREDLRQSDQLVRWGEQRFLLILPGTDCDGASITVERIRNNGIGTLPDGKPVTASIGVVERLCDAVADMPTLIQLLDRRREQAEREGRDRAILCGTGL